LGTPAKALVNPGRGGRRTCPARTPSLYKAHFGRRGFSADFCSIDVSDRFGAATGRRGDKADRPSRHQYRGRETTARARRPIQSEKRSRRSQPRELIDRPASPQIKIAARYRTAGRTRLSAQRRGTLRANFGHGTATKEAHEVASPWHLNVPGRRDPGSFRRWLSTQDHWSRILNALGKGRTYFRPRRAARPGGSVPARRGARDGAHLGKAAAHKSCCLCTLYTKTGACGQDRSVCPKSPRAHRDGRVRSAYEGRKSTVEGRRSAIGDRPSNIDHRRSKDRR